MMTELEAQNLIASDESLNAFGRHFHQLVFGDDFIDEKYAAEFFLLLDS
jgi:hypothetical protein